MVCVGSGHNPKLLGFPCIGSTVKTLTIRYSVKVAILAGMGVKISYAICEKLNENFPFSLLVVL